MLLCQGFHNLEASQVPTQQSSGTPMELLFSCCELLLNFPLLVIPGCA